MARGGKTSVDASALLAAIQGGQLDPIYCLTGAESYLVQACLRALRGAVLGADADPARASLNLETYDLKEQPLRAAIAAARTRSLLGGRRLVHVRGIDLPSAEELEPLRAYLEAPSPDACLVLTCDKADKVDGRLRTFAALKKAGWLHEFKRLGARELPGWIETEARARGLRIEPDAARALAEAAGPDLGRLAQALEQLALFVARPPGEPADGAASTAEGRPAPITRAAVEALVPESREHQNYEITRAIQSGQTARALQLLHEQFASGGAAPTTLAILLQGSLSSLVRQLWRTSELLRAGTPPSAIGAALGVQPWLGEELARAAPRFSARTLMRAVGRIYENDRALKSSRGDARANLSRLVHDLSERRLA